MPGAAAVKKIRWPISLIGPKKVPRASLECFNPPLVKYEHN